MSHSILLNPAARVYTLRFLLIATISTIYASVRDIVVDAYGLTTIFSLAFVIIIWTHHILGWTLRGLAAIDLTIVGIEIWGLLHFASVVLADTWGTSLPVIPPVLFLFFSLLFRITMIVKTQQGVLVRQFTFLGCCAPTHPPYTPASILLNRSLARPLVRCSRGESKYIIIVRAVVLSPIAVGVPAFGIYVVATILVPSPQSFTPADLDNATITFRRSHLTFEQSPGSWNYIPDRDSWPPNGSVATTDNINCPIINFTATCPCGWSAIDTISISALIPLEAVFVAVGIGCDSGQCDPTVLSVPLLPGSRLFGILAWSHRQTISQSKATSGVIFSPEVSGLQQNTSSEGNVTSLTLSVVHPPIRYFQDTVNASALSGISTFGGFWTFVNGTFALFFGAKIVYFAFGRRPLSALGVVHLFQRRALVRRWYEDFPAIQKEGGSPGSENAGIVAFIRERLVNLGEDHGDIEQQSRRKRSPKNGKLRRVFPWKKKVQRFNHRVQSARTSIQASQDSEPMHTDVYLRCQGPSLTADAQDFAASDVAIRPRSLRGWILDEIPLLDTDVGFKDGAQNIHKIEDTFPPRV
ncbi:hypothetical protein C8R45DRAFT_938772 [Mycena sanguinolenta]|nr:hypothetical protein C8R45DRAFT_938772 [Mycena sanguinolenta]